MTVMMIQKSSTIGSPGSGNRKNAAGVTSADAGNETTHSINAAGSAGLSNTIGGAVSNFQSNDA